MKKLLVIVALSANIAQAHYSDLLRPIFNFSDTVIKKVPERIKNNPVESLAIAYGAGELKITSFLLKSVFSNPLPAAVGLIAGIGAAKMGTFSRTALSGKEKFASDYLAVAATTLSSVFAYKIVSTGCYLGYKAGEAITTNPAPTIFGGVSGFIVAAHLASKRNLKPGPKKMVIAATTATAALAACYAGAI